MMKGVIAATLIFFATGVAQAQQLSQIQLEEYVAILLTDRIQLMKENDQLKLTQADQQRETAALADYWKYYVEGLDRRK